MALAGVHLDDLDTVPHLQVTELGGFHADEWIVEVGPRREIAAVAAGEFLPRGKKLVMNQE